jgi:hypothetical protein
MPVFLSIAAFSEASGPMCRDEKGVILLEFEMRLQIYNTSITKELIKSWKNL